MLKFLSKMFNINIILESKENKVLERDVVEKKESNMPTGKKLERFKNARKVVNELIKCEQEKELFYKKYGSECEDERRCELIKNHLRPATKQDYENWLLGWIENGNPVRHLDRNFDNWSMYVAESDFIIIDKYCGSTSISIIVPEHIRFSVVNIGHCSLFCMKDFDCFGTSGIVSSYDDLFLEGEVE